MPLTEKRTLPPLPLPIRQISTIALLGTAAIATALLVPPIRDKVFSTKLWPWPLPWDTNKQELEQLMSLCMPGDIILESNLHGWQWVCLCFATTGTTWVHAAIVDENKRLLTVERAAIETDFDIYLRWGSTRLALIRPPYASTIQVSQALAYARSKLGTQYDASFQDHAGNCNGLVASALAHSGMSVPLANCFGRTVYAPDCFFKIPGAETIWLSDSNRLGVGSKLPKTLKGRTTSSTTVFEVPQPLPSVTKDR